MGNAKPRQYRRSRDHVATRASTWLRGAATLSQRLPDSPRRASPPPTRTQSTRGLLELMARGSGNASARNECLNLDEIDLPQQRQLIAQAPVRDHFPILNFQDVVDLIGDLVSCGGDAAKRAGVGAGNCLPGPDLVAARRLVVHRDDGVGKGDVHARKYLSHAAAVSRNAWQRRVIDEALGKNLIDQIDIFPVLNFLDHQIDESDIGTGHASAYLGRNFLDGQSVQPC